MKKQLLFSLALILTNTFIFTSCTKDDAPAPAPKTKTELLTQSNWKFKSAFVGATDYSSSLQTCQKDNIYTFVAAGTGTADEGPLKCNAGDPQTSPFTWNWAASETILHISLVLFTNTTNDFTLVSISETELVVQTFYTPPVGPSFQVTITFQH